jgi:hypothetical protein
MICSWNPFELYYFFRLKNVLNIFLELLFDLTIFCYFLIGCLIFHRVHVCNAKLCLCFFILKCAILV